MSVARQRVGDVRRRRFQRVGLYVGLLVIFIVLRERTFWAWVGIVAAAFALSMQLGLLLTHRDDG